MTASPPERDGVGGLLDVAEEAVRLLEYTLEDEAIGYEDCAAIDGQALCGAGPCQAIGCIVDKLKRANNVLTELAICGIRATGATS